MRAHSVSFPALFVVRRDSIEEHTIAIVQAHVTRKELQATSAFREALISAFTRWVATRPEGKQAWRLTAHDFNIGDLAHWIGTKSLQRQCGLHGILDLTVSIFSGDDTTPWTFDTVLVDECALDSR